MAGTKAKGGKKNRKLGRNSVACKRYANEGRELKNRLRKMRKHLRRNKTDAQNLAAFKKFGGSEDAIFT